MTTSEIATILSIPDDQVRKRLNNPARKGHWVSPADGLWIPVPPEYRTWGAPEGIEIVDGLMDHFRTDYYIGWLSAAAIHGAAHHAPQFFQVATATTIRDRKVGRTNFRFITRSRVGKVPTVRQETRAGYAVVSTVEATALDIADSANLVGGLDSAATVLIELAEEETLSLETLLQLVRIYPASTVRRLGWILAAFTSRKDLKPLEQYATAASTAPSKLDTSRPSRGPIDKTWALIINTEIDPDV